MPELLTPFEIASGLPFGADRGAEPLPVSPNGLGPRAAFEQVVLEALRRPPCFVTFSGGRDSSAVLAVAADLARREGLDPPIPITNVFPHLPESDERDWQERVLGHLGLTARWRRLELGDDLDFVGDVAAPVLRRHGVLFPANAHFHVPPLRVAAGGSMLTGWGGDEALGGRHSERVLLALTGRTRPEPADLRRLAFWALPLPLRRATLRRVGDPGFEWMTEHGRARAVAAWASDWASDPRHWSTT